VYWAWPEGLDCYDAHMPPPQDVRPQLCINCKHKRYPENVPRSITTPQFSIRNADCQVDSCLALNTQWLKDDRLFVAPDENLGTCANSKRGVSSCAHEVPAERLTGQGRRGTKHAPNHHALALTRHRQACGVVTHNLCAVTCSTD
jgi:hypothetical protein